VLRSQTHHFLPHLTRHRARNPTKRLLAGSPSCEKHRVAPGSRPRPGNRRNDYPTWPRHLQAIGRHRSRALDRIFLHLTYSFVRCLMTGHTQGPLSPGLAHGAHDLETSQTYTKAYLGPSYVARNESNIKPQFLDTQRRFTEIKTNKSQSISGRTLRSIQKRSVLLS